MKFLNYKICNRKLSKVLLKKLIGGGPSRLTRQAAGQIFLWAKQQFNW